MVIDHVNVIWLDRAFFSLLLIGRGAFPLFCYAAAIAILRADLQNPRRLWEREKQLFRLLAVAVAAQPFYWYALGEQTANVLFTLALGGIFAKVSLQLKRWHLYSLYGAGLASTLAWPLPVDFGMAGVMLPSAIVLALRGERSVIPFLLLMIFSMNAAGMLTSTDEKVWIILCAFAVAGTLLPLLVLDIAKSLPQQGRLLPKYALHVFYPAHLALLKVFS